MFDNLNRVQFGWGYSLSWSPPRSCCSTLSSPGSRLPSDSSESFCSPHQVDDAARAACKESASVPLSRTP